MRAAPLVRVIVTAGVVATMTAGCLSGGGETADPEATAAAEGPGKSTVEVMYGFGQDQEVAFKKDLEAFAGENDFAVKFTKAGSWDTEIRSRVSGGSPPDVGLFPQPGVMCQLASDGSIIPYDADTIASAEETLVPGFVGAGTCPDGKTYGLPSAVSVKSLLFYSQAAFEEAGYTVPETLDDLTALTDQIRGEGKTPWCIAAESGAATGWPITDFIEDLVLRYAGPEDYDRWVTGELDFNSPEIKPAFEYFEQIAFTKGNVRGGTKAIAATNFQTGGNGLFADPPTCYLFKQATFIAAPGGFPDEVVAALDEQVGVAPFPPLEAGNNPVLTGGDLAAAFNNDANTLALRNFIASNANGTETGTAGFFSPHTDFDSSLYPNETLRTIATDVLYPASAARFDGSDLMPAEVGAGTFWTELVKWVSGQQELEDTLSAIDDSFPAAG